MICRPSIIPSSTSLVPILVRTRPRWRTTSPPRWKNNSSKFPVWTSSPAQARRETPVSPSSSLSRSEEHTSELQSHSDLVCRLLLEKKKSHQTKRQLEEYTRTQAPK